jgi:hypothetical protein
MIIVVDCFPERQRGTAGGVQGGGELRPQIFTSNPCNLEPTKAIRECAGAKGRGRGQREKSGSSYLVGIDGFRRRRLRTPTVKFTGLAANLREEGERKWRGRRGLLIGTARARNGQG